MTITDLVSLSEIDSNRFGVNIARSNLATSDNLASVLEFCKEKQVDLLISRCGSTDIASVHAMEKAGFLLMDTLVYLKKDLRDYSPQSFHSEVNYRTVKPDDIPQVVEVARSSFSGYRGHYHADPLLDAHKATEAYASWAERCCEDPSVAARVLVAEFQDEIVGFRAIRVNSPQQAEFILAGVSPQARNKGVYRGFVIEGLRWCKEIGAEEVLVSTLLVNTAVQKACTQMGFGAHNSYYTFHKWFK